MYFRMQFANSEFDALDPDLKIVLRLSVGLSDSIQLVAKEDELLCSWSIEKQDAGTMWSVRVFDLPPPQPTYPLRFILMTLELTAPNKMNVIFGGNTKPFQEKFYAEDMKLKMQKITGSTYAEYYRVIEHLKMDEDVTPCVDRLKHVLSNTLHDSPVIVQINDKKQDAELAFRVVAEIKKLPNIEMRA